MTATMWDSEIFAETGAPESAAPACPAADAAVPPPADPRLLRQAFGTFATGVVALTYQAGGSDYGVTVNSFTSVSLDPPLLLVSMQRTSRALSHLLEHPFAVNVLAEGQLDTALHFAGKPQPRPVDWVRGEAAPRVDGALAYFQCTPWASYDGGDHVLVLGRVTEFGQRDDVQPLLFHRGQWNIAGKTAESRAGDGAQPERNRA